MGTISQTGAVNQSITRAGRIEPWGLQAGRQQISLHYPIAISGYSASVGSTAFGPLWEGLTPSGGLYSFPGAAAQLSIVSTSASDTTALSVFVMGLDANYNPLSEVVALNGTTPVTTVGSYLRINGMSCTNGSNVGTITAKISSTVYAQINPAVGQTQMAIFTVPAGYTFYLENITGEAAIGFTSSNYMLFEEVNTSNLSATEFYGPYSWTNTAGTTILGQTTFVQILNVPYNYPVPHAGGTDIQYALKANTGSPFTATVTATGILVKNDGTL